MPNLGAVRQALGAALVVCKDLEAVPGKALRVIFQVALEAGLLALVFLVDRGQVAKLS
jgi:hypothetical protein